LYVVYIRKEFRSCARGVSGVAFFIIIDELYNTEAAIFPMQAMSP